MITRDLHGQRGVALALLLWMLAGMTLMVAGIISLSRSDVQLTALQLDQARAQAVAIGAAHAALRDMYALSLAGVQDGGANRSRSYVLGGVDVQVTVVPVNGLINLNAADHAVLSTLLQYAGGLHEDDAQTLATAIVAWRNGEPDGDESLQDFVRAPFLVEEELLRVPGMTRDVYEGLHRFVHTSPGAVGGVDLLAAPESLLNAWRSVDPDAVDFALQSRQDDARNDAPAGPVLPSGMVGGGMYHMEVDVRITESRTFRQRISVELSGATGGPPWRFSRVYPMTLLPTHSEEARIAI